MSSPERLVAVGRVGRPHGRDGSFWVEGALERAESEGWGDPLAEGEPVVVAGRQTRVERRGGEPSRPLARLAAIETREAAAALRGEELLVSEGRAPLGDREWLVEDLVGASVEGVGEVRRVLAAPSCDLLEVGEEGLLIPLVADAVLAVDVKGRRIAVDRRFLGLDDEDVAAAPPPGGAGGSAAAGSSS